MKAPRGLDSRYMERCRDLMDWNGIDKALRDLYRIQTGKEASKHGALLLRDAITAKITNTATITTELHPKRTD